MYIDRINTARAGVVTVITLVTDTPAAEPDARFRLVNAETYGIDARELHAMRCNSIRFWDAIPTCILDDYSFSWIREDGVRVTTYIDSDTDELCRTYGYPMSGREVRAHDMSIGFARDAEHVGKVGNQNAAKTSLAWVTVDIVVMPDGSPLTREVMQRRTYLRRTSSPAPATKTPEMRLDASLIRPGTMTDTGRYVSV